MPTPQGPPTVVIRPEAFTPEALAEHGWTSLRDAAAAASLAPSTLSRLVRQELTPGPLVIAALMGATGRPFDDLFTIDPAPAPREDVTA